MDQLAVQSRKTWKKKTQSTSFIWKYLKDMVIEEELNLEDTRKDLKEWLTDLFGLSS